MKPKHMQFAMNYLRTKDAELAYKLTYPRAGVQSLASAASRLLARDDISTWLEATEDAIRSRAIAEVEQEEAGKLRHELLSINQKRDILAKMATGQYKRKRFIKTKYGATQVEDDLHPFAILKAIDLDTRLEMFYNFLLSKGMCTSQNTREGQQYFVNAPSLQQQVNILIAEAQQPHAQQNNIPWYLRSEALATHTAGQQSWLSSPPEKKSVILNKT